METGRNNQFTSLTGGHGNSRMLTWYKEMLWLLLCVVEIRYSEYSLDEYLKEVEHLPLPFLHVSIFPASLSLLSRPLMHTHLLFFYLYLLHLVSIKNDLESAYFVGKCKIHPVLSSSLPFPLSCQCFKYNKMKQSVPETMTIFSKTECF